MKADYGKMAYILSAVLALAACSRSEPKGAETAPRSEPSEGKQNRLRRDSITKLDGGQLTRYAPSAKELTEAAPGTSARRSLIVLNDPASPVEIS